MWQWALLPILLVAVYTDWRWRKIFNWLTFPALGLGLVLSAVTGGVPALLSGLAGAGVAFGVFLVLYLLMGFGAGDLKLMTAIGAWLGYPLILTDILYVGVAGGVIALAFAMRYGVLKEVARNLYYFFATLMVSGGKVETALPKSAMPPFPYGVAIALGTLATLVESTLPLWRGG